MNEKEIFELIEQIHNRQYESRDIEVKSGREGNPRKFYDTLSSFSNTSGGTIVFGIDEKSNFEICGLKDVKAMQQIVQEVSKEMEPVVRPTITPIQYKNGANLLVVEVEEMEFIEKPCYYRPLGLMKGSFIRTGDGDELMTEFEIYQFQIFKTQSQTELETFDSITFENIDNVKLDAFLAQAVENKPNFSNLGKVQIMEMLGLTRKSLPTLLCLLMFGRYPQEIAPMMGIVCTKVSGSDYISTDSVNNRFLANESIGGTINQMFQSTLKFVKSNIQTQTIIDNNGDRNDISEYPIVALRELLMNALLHRDYSYLVRNIPISVTIFDNRIEISNPGSLLGNYKVDDLGSKYLPLRNPFLCRNMEDLMKTENRHSGILAAIKDMESNDLLPPLFEVNRGFFKVTLFNTKITDKKIHDISKELVKYCYRPRTKQSIAEHFGFNAERSTYFFNTYVKPLINKKILFLTIPELPNSKFQKVTSNYLEVDR